MRKILVLMLCIFSIGCFAQDSLRYEKVIQCEGVSAGDAYKRVESLFGSMPKSSGRSIQARNPENKTLEINGVTVFRSVKMNAGYINGAIRYVLHLRFKDDRFQAEMTHITHFGGKKMYNFGLIYDVEVPEKKIAFAPKEWKSEIYEEMKATAFNEFDMICKEVLARVQNGSESW